MEISKSLSRHRARKIWEEHNRACILPGMHLHHCDANCRNNEPANLVVCTAEEHVEFHRQLGHKINDNFIAKANFFAEMSPEEQQAFREAGREYASRRTKLARSPESILKQKLSSAYRAHRLEMVHAKTGKIEVEFFSVKEAAEKLGIQRAHVRRVISGKRKQWRGYVFRYKE